MQPGALLDTRNKWQAIWPDERGRGARQWNILQPERRTGAVCFAAAIERKGGLKDRDSRPGIQRVVRSEIQRGEGDDRRADGDDVPPGDGATGGDRRQRD